MERIEIPGGVTVLQGHVLDALATLPDGSVQCCVTSPPYWNLRDYGVAGQIGLEPSPELYVAALVEVFAEVWRVLRDDGTFWLNIGDSYARNGGELGGGNRELMHLEGKQTRMARIPAGSNLKPKDLCMIPARAAIALQAWGWWIRSDIIWAKRAPMPESVTDRPTSAHEHIFLLAKNEKYYYDAAAVMEPASMDSGFSKQRLSGVSNWSQGTVTARIGCHTKGNEGAGSLWQDKPFRNLRNVWHLSPEPVPESHFATFVTEIPRRAILAGTSQRGCCPACSAPWERNIEGAHTGRLEADGINRGTDRRGIRKRCGEAQHETLGWRSGCTCDAGEPIPCTVLDPFGGSGTTALVARQLGRRSVLCELNPEYVEIMRQRLNAAQETLFAPEMNGHAGVGQSGLFAEPDTGQAQDVAANEVVAR